MNFLLAVVLLPLTFTAPADTLGTDAMGRVEVSSSPVCAYLFYRRGPHGTVTAIPGYADSTGKAILEPHMPGTREAVWLAPDPNGNPATIFLISRDERGNLSAPSNECDIERRHVPATSDVRGRTTTALVVPVVEQARERCGQAALTMVLRYYGAAPVALSEVDTAYDPVLRGSLITDLAGAARRAGYKADVATLTPDSVIDLLYDGVPPILLYQNGFGPLTVKHFGVVTGWDSTRRAFTLQDGGPSPRVTGRDDLVKRWETAGSQALIVRQRVP